MTDEQTLSDYLPTVKSGDSVLVRGGGSYTVTKHEVEKITRTQIVTSSGYRFKLADGWEVGGTKWAPRSILVPTEENRKTELVGRLARWGTVHFPAAFAKLSFEKQHEIYKLVAAHLAPTDAG